VPRLRAAAPLLVPAAALLVAYLAYPIAAGIRTPVGPDGPLYVWWTRLAEVEGLGIAPGRGGGPALALMLGGILRLDALAAVAAVGPALALATGLAAAGLLDVTLGRASVRTAAAVLLAGAWAAYLAPSWLAGLLLVLLLLAAAAAFAEAEGSGRAAVAGGALLGAAGLSHRYMFTLAVVLLAGPLVLLVPDALRRIRGGTPPASTWAGRIGLGMAGGAAVTALGLLTPARAVAGDTSQDAFLRRTGLVSELREHFRRRVIGDGRRGLIPGLPAAALWFAGRGWEGPRRRFLAVLCAWWAAITVTGALVLLAAPVAQGNRLVATAFFLPLAAAPGLALLWRRAGWRRWAAAGLAAVTCGGAMYGWYRQETHLPLDEVRTVSRAAPWLGAEDPPVVLVDTEEVDAALHVVRWLNLTRAGAPRDAIRGIAVAVGRPRDAVAGRATLNGDTEHDRLAKETVGVLDGRDVLVLAPFTPWYREARAMGRQVAPGVVVLRGAPGPGPSLPIPSGLSPAALIGSVLAALALLAVVGWPWAGWAIRSAGARAALAPAFGAAALILAGTVVDTAGVRLSGPVPAVLAAMVTAAGHLVVRQRGAGADPSP